MKRFCILLSVVMYFGFTAMSYGAAVISVELSDLKLTAVGPQLTASINVTGGKGIAGYQITVNFDPNVLSYVSWANADYLPAGAIPASPTVSDGSVIIAAVSPLNTAPDGNGTLATVTFDVIKPEATTIYLTSAVLTDAEAQSLESIIAMDHLLEGVAEEALASETPFTTAGPKIEGPWLWMIVSTGEIGGKAAALSGKDYLAAASGGSVTEQQIAMNGATADDPVGDKVWTSSKIVLTGYDNITNTVNAIGLGTGNNIDNHVAYGSIFLLSPREQNTTMYVGSDDAVKVWLNGELVHDNPIDRAASDYQDSFPVTLKYGKNILLVAVYEFEGGWNGFFGFENDAAYILTPAVKVSASERPPMYWINTETGGTLYQLIGEDVENYGAGVQNITSLAIDTVKGKIYAAQKTSDHTGIIGRADLDGSNVELVKELNNVPQGIAVDPSNGKLYLTNSRGKVQRFNLDGSNFEWNFIVDLNSPQGIALDVAGGKVYWTEQTGENTGRVRRADLDGSNVELVKELNNVPQGIAVDPSNGKLYLTNSRGKVQRFNLDGSNFEWNFIVNLSSPQGIALDIAGGKIYWTEEDSIRRADLNGENIEDVVTGLGTPTGIVLEYVTINAPAAPAIVELPPDATVLLANYPNPFNPETWIPYQLASASNVKITIYEAKGTLVRTLVLGHQPAGYYTSRNRAAYWDGRNTLGERVASGIYFYQLQADDLSLLRKMIILK